MESSTAGQAHFVGDLVAGLAVVLILGISVVISVVMIRASKAQRARRTRTDFGGRYSDFGFLLGIFRANDHKQEEGKAIAEASVADRDRGSR
jgi:hypothetical protein